MSSVLLKHSTREPIGNPFLPSLTVTSLFDKLYTMEQMGPVTLSIIIPALNEAENLEACVREVIRTIPKSLTYELLVFNDGSSDRTGAIGEVLQKEFSTIHLFHNPRPMGIGYNYVKGVEKAQGAFVMMVPGDNEIRFASLAPSFEKLGSYDILIPYAMNPQVRPRIRRLISNAFTMICNTLFDLRVRYFNGPCIHRTELVRSIFLDTSGFAYMAGILVRLIKSGAAYTHVPMELRPRLHGASKAFRLRNALSVGQVLFSLIREIYFSKKFNIPYPGKHATQ